MLLFPKRVPHSCIDCREKRRRPYSPKVSRAIGPLAAFWIIADYKVVLVSTVKVWILKVKHLLVGRLQIHGSWLQGGPSPDGRANNRICGNLGSEVERGGVPIQVEKKVHVDERLERDALSEGYQNEGRVVGD